MNRRREKRRIAKGGLPPGAVAADTTQQVPVNPYGSKKPFYVDIPFKCEGCGRDEVWTADQQKWYFEEAKGTLYATAKRCRNCRNLVSEAKEIQREQMNRSDKNQNERGAKDNGGKPV